VITHNLICLFGTQSSGSGSESGIHTQKCVKPNTGDKYENNVSSSHDDEEEEDDDLSVGLSARDGSDNGSGTQVCVH
jgi:pseudo-response regulator 7